MRQDRERKADLSDSDGGSSPKTILRAGLARRFIVFASLLVLVTSLSLSLVVLARQQVKHDKQIRRRGVSLARSLAYNAEAGVLTRDGDLLHDLAGGLLRESDVLSVTVTDNDGEILLQDTMARGDTPGPAGFTR